MTRRAAATAGDPNKKPRRLHQANGGSDALSQPPPAPGAEENIEDEEDDDRTGTPPPPPGGAAAHDAPPATILGSGAADVPDGSLAAASSSAPPATPAADAVRLAPLATAGHITPPAAATPGTEAGTPRTRQSPAQATRELFFHAWSTANGNDKNLDRSHRMRILTGHKGNGYMIGRMSPLSVGAPTPATVSLRCKPGFIDGIMAKAGGADAWMGKKVVVRGATPVTNLMADALLRRDFGAETIAVYSIEDATADNADVLDGDGLPTVAATLPAVGIDSNFWLRFPPIPPANRLKVDDNFGTAGRSRALLLVPVEHSSSTAGAFVKCMLLGSSSASTERIGGLESASWGCVDLSLGTPNTVRVPAYAVAWIDEAIPAKKVIIAHGTIASRQAIRSDNLSTTIWGTSAVLSFLHAGPLQDAILASARNHMLAVAGVQPPPPDIQWETRDAAAATLNGNTFLNATITILATPEPYAPPEVAGHAVLPLAVTAGGVTFAACVISSSVALRLPVVATFLPQGLETASSDAINALAFAQGQYGPLVQASVTVEVVAGTAVVRALSLPA